jgi:FlaA1/EpsC-like NDP-sugar epimerase
MSDLYRAVIRFIDQRLLSVTGLALGLAVLCVYVVLFAINEKILPAQRAGDLLVHRLFLCGRLAHRHAQFPAQPHQPPAGQRMRSPSTAPARPGARLAQTMRSSDEYRPVCFFDDKHVLNERTIAGLRVFHTDRLAEMVAALASAPSSSPCPPCRRNACATSCSAWPRPASPPRS